MRILCGYAIEINEVSRTTRRLQITKPIYSVVWNSHITPLRSSVLNISGDRKHVFSRRMDKNNISLGSVAGIHFTSWCNIRHGSDGRTEDVLDLMKHLIPLLEYI